VLAGTSSELGDFVDAKFYCPHALADSKQCIWIRSWSSPQQCYLQCLHTLSPMMESNVVHYGHYNVVQIKL